MISLGMPQSARDGLKMVIDDLRFKIENLEAESQVK